MMAMKKLNCWKWLTATQIQLAEWFLNNFVATRSFNFTFPEPRDRVTKLGEGKFLPTFVLTGSTKCQYIFLLQSRSVLF